MRPFLSRFVGPLLLLLAGLPLFSAAASESQRADTAGLTLRGFGTLGVARSSSDNADFVRDLSQPDGSRGGWTGKTDSLVAAQGNYRFDERLEGVLQVVSRYRYDRSYRPEVGWAFLKYDPDPGLSLRVGRVGTEFYMLADSRLVGYSYLPVRPPTDYFSTLPIYHLNGGDAVLTVPAGPGLARLKAFYGTADEKIPITDWVWDFSGSLLLGAYFDYLQGAWQWRLSYAQLRFRNDFPENTVRGALRAAGVPSAIAAADALSVGGRRAHYYSAGVAYDKGPVQAQLMLSRTTHESAMFENSYAGYALFGYRFSSLTPYVGFSRAKSSSRNLATVPHDAAPEFAGLNAGVTAIMGQSHIDQSTIFLGVRWDVRPSIALKIQWDGVRGRPASIAFQQWENPAWRGRTNVLSLSLDFLF